MNKQRLAQRAAGVGLAAVLGLGIAGPATSAATAETGRSVTAAAAQPSAPSAPSTFTAADIAALKQIGFSGKEIEQLRQDAAKKGMWGTVWKILKKAGKLKSGIAAAKKGIGAFKKWWNKKVPRTVKWALRAAGWGGSLLDLYRVMRGW